MRHVTKKTALVSAIALLAGVSLASAQGQKEVPGGGGQSPGMSGAQGGGGAPSAAPGGAEPRGGGGEMRGGQSGGGQQMDRGRAEKPAMQDRTTGQGAREGSRDSAQPQRGAEQPAREQMKGKAAQDKAAQDKAARDPMKGKAAQEKAAPDKAAQDKASQDKARSTTGQGSRDAAQPDKSKASQQPSQQQTQQPQRQQEGTTGAAPQQGQTGATTQGQSGSVTLDAQKQASIQQNVLSARNAPRVTNVNFSVSVGAVVPSRVRYVSLSTYPILIETFPQYRDYSFFIVEEEIVIIEPRTRRIVQVVPVGSGGRAARGGSATVTSTEVLHLSEPEIREVQLVLVQRGLLTRSQVDGIWGPNTREALITFQRREGLSASGSIDTRTVTALGLSGKISAGQQGTTGSSPASGQQQSQQPSATQPQSQQGAQPSGQQPSAQQPQGQQSQQQGQTPSTTGSAPSTTGQGGQQGGGQQGSQPSGQLPSAAPSGQQQPGSGAQPQQQDQKK